VTAVKSRLLFWFSNGLIVAGLSLLLAVGGLWGYSQYEEARAAQEVAQLTTTAADAGTPVPSAPALPGMQPSTGTLAAEPSPTVTVASHESADTTAQFVPWSLRFQATATPNATPTPRPISPAQRIVAPSIHLDVKVEESPIVNNEWVVPKFAAGHLQGTAQPLQGGNVVFDGHIQSLSSGDVFANIARLRPGSQIRVYTKTDTITYTVTQVETVTNTDLAVVAPSSQERLTLITCIGTWLPLQHDYNDRTVVIANHAG